MRPWCGYAAIFTGQSGVWTWALPCRIFGPLSWVTHSLLGKKISGLCLMDQDWKMVTHPHHLGHVVLRLGKWRCQGGLQGCHPVQREVQARIVQTWKSSLPLCAHPEWLWLGHRLSLSQTQCLYPAPSWRSVRAWLGPTLFMKLGTGPAVVLKPGQLREKRKLSLAIGPQRSGTWHREMSAVTA